MTPNDEDRERRWLAYFLGELPVEERAEVEGELSRDPKAAAEMRSLFEEVEAWSEEPVPYTPLRAKDLPLEPAAPSRAPQFEIPPLSAQSRRPTPIGANGYRLAMTLAAAAMFLFALSRLEFTLRIGGSDLRWGHGPVSLDAVELKSGLASIEGKVEDLTQLTQLQGGQIREVAATASARTGLLETELLQTATELYRMQQVESQTRYRDVRQILRMSGYEDGTSLWADGHSSRVLPGADSASWNVQPASSKQSQK